MTFEVQKADQEKRRTEVNEAEGIVLALIHGHMESIRKLNKLLEITRPLCQPDESTK